MTSVLSWMIIACLVMTGRSVDREYAIQAFRDMEEATQRLDTSLRVGVFNSLATVDGIELTERPSTAGKEADWSSFHWRSFDGRVRVERTREGAPNKIFIWTGSAWAEWTTELAAARIRPTPRLDIQTDCWGWFNVNDWPGIAGIGPWSDLVATATQLESSDVDGALQLTFIPLGTPVTTTILLDRTDPPRLRSITQDIGPGKDGFRHVVHFQVENWERYHGIYIPSRAYRLSIVTGAHDQAGVPIPPGASLVVFEREWSRSISEPDPQWFSLTPMDDATVIHDQRMRMSYRPGYSDLLFDGMLLHTTDPIRGYFDDNVPPTDFTTNGHARSTNGHTRWLIASVLVSVAIALPVGVLRSEQRALRRISIRAAIKLYVGVLLVTASAVLVLCLPACTSKEDSVAGPASDTTDQSPLVGSSTHDFGDVLFSGRKVQLSHVFHLTNDSDHVVQIQSVTASCGCTKAVTSNDVIGPGESVDVEAVMDLVAPRRRSETVWINMGEDGVKPLRITANVFRPIQLALVQQSVDLTDGDKTITVILTSRTSNDPPASEPSITLPPGVVAKFGGWTQFSAMDVEAETPAAWAGRVHLIPTRGFVGGVATLSMMEERPLKVELTGRPWLPARLPARDEFESPARSP